MDIAFFKIDVSFKLFRRRNAGVEDTGPHLPQLLEIRRLIADSRRRQ